MTQGVGHDAGSGEEPLYLGRDRFSERGACMGTKMKESFYGQRRGSAPQASNISSSPPGETLGFRGIAGAMATIFLAGLLGCFF